jgi:sarcosine oxidase delta subunit
LEKSKLTETEKGETGKEQSQEQTHHFDIKGNVHKEFVLKSQTVNSAYYCDALWRLRENGRRLRPELWRERTGCCITTTHRLTLLFHQGFFFLPKTT